MIDRAQHERVKIAMYELAKATSEHHQLRTPASDALFHNAAMQVVNMLVELPTVFFDQESKIGGLISVGIGIANASSEDIAEIIEGQLREVAPLEYAKIKSGLGLLGARAAGSA